MDLVEISALIDALEKDASLHNDRNFEARAEALDVIETLLIDLAEHEATTLNTLANELKAKLETVDERLFEKLQANIRSGDHRGSKFSDMIRQYLDLDHYLDKNDDAIGYDALDSFVNGLFPLKAMPEQIGQLGPEMVYYQKTPARIIFKLVDRMRFDEDEVFVDLGSGLGHVAMLVALLTGIKVKGIEFEPAFCRYATECASALNIKNVEFINIDARQVDYTEGTIFFMFTPFTGSLMEAVLARLKQQAQHRIVRIVTYGPCTSQVGARNWLTTSSNNQEFGIFTSSRTLAAY